MKHNKNISSLISQFQRIADNPIRAVQDIKMKSKKKLVGIAPYYAPEEIVYAAGMVPIGIWGGKINFSSANNYLPPFACPLMKSILELAIKGAYDDFAAIVFPSQCENNKLTGQNFKVAKPGIHFIPLVHPQNRKYAEGIEFLRSEYEQIAVHLSKISGSEISNESLFASIDIYNKYRQSMRQLTELIPRYPKIITPHVRHNIIMTSFLMDKADFTFLIQELISNLEQAPETTIKCKKVIVTGTILEPVELLDLFEELGIQIVADDLAQGSRHFRADVPQGDEDPYTRLARRWSLMEGCSLVFDPEKRRGIVLKNLFRNSNADGLIVLMTQFCDPEELDYPLYKRELEQEGIPILLLELEPHMQIEQIRTRLETFIEMLR